MTTDNQPYSNLINLSGLNRGNRKILMVDDDPECILLIREIFASSFLTILYARNGTCGLNKLIENPDINLVLLDIRLPDLNGFEVFRNIKYVNDLIPIIAITADVTTEMIFKCKEAGFDGVVTKPFNLDTLKNKVYSMLVL